MQEAVREKLGEEAGAARPAGVWRLSWPALLLTLAAVTSSSLSALCLHQLLALRVEVEGLRSDVCRRREEQRQARHGEEMLQLTSRSGRTSTEPTAPPGPMHGLPPLRTRRQASGAVTQPCLQMLGDSTRATFQKEFALETHTGIPWQAGLRRGSALEVESDSMVVREEGFYFVYSQVYYMDATFAMGHVVVRRKGTVVGDEPQHVILFRCIQIMNPVYPYNTCYTGGIVKLDVGDHVELLIPRPTANVSLDGDSTFLGAVRLA
ncbi:tumor necrosis factor ligand superfamily member 13B [Aplochiton taeniatus]